MPDLYRQPLPFKRWKLGRTGADALTSTYWRQYIKSDPNMTNLTTTIEIVFAPDQRVFAATEPINSVSSSTGRAYQYAPILQSEPEISSSIEIGSSTSKARSFSIQIPNTFVDAAKLIRSGRYLSGFAEVSLQFDGCDYDQRIVLMRGEMDSGVTFYPAEGESSSSASLTRRSRVTIRAPRTRSTTLLVAASQTRQMTPTGQGIH